MLSDRNSLYLRIATVKNNTFNLLGVIQKNRTDKDVHPTKNLKIKG